MSKQTSERAMLERLQQARIPAQSTISHEAQTKQLPEQVAQSSQDNAESVKEIAKLTKQLAEVTQAGKKQKRLTLYLLSSTQLGPGQSFCKHPFVSDTLK